MAATKKSYAIPCSSAFRDRVQALADRRGVNAGDLVRSVMLVVPPEAIAAMADPGEPADHDRETITLKSGPGAGKALADWIMAGHPLYVLGFPPNAKLSPEAIKSRFRALAAIHHPDSAFGDTRRMSQLNEAMATLRTLGF